MSYENMVKQYGEDNAQFLYETLCDTKKNYGQFSFIEMGIEPDDRFERQTRSEADEKGWAFEKLKGDLSLIQQLVNGEWNENDFLTVRPGQRVVARYDEKIFEAEETDSLADHSHS